MYNPFAKDLEILKNSQVKYDFLIKGWEEDVVKGFSSSTDFNEGGSTGYLDWLLHELSQEKINLENEIEKFLNDPTIIKSFSEEGGNIAKILEVLNGLLIRLKRYNSIVTPTIYEFKFKSGPYTYDKSSAVWINDKGAKNKNFSRNFGNCETDLIVVVENMLIKSLNAKIQKEVQLTKLRVDLKATIDDKNWYFEIKRIDKENVIKTATVVDMWQHYKKIYHL